VRAVTRLGRAEEGEARRGWAMSGRGTRPEGCAWADWLPRRALGRGMCQLHGPAKGQRVTKLNCLPDL